MLLLLAVLITFSAGAAEDSVTCTWTNQPLCDSPARLLCTCDVSRTLANGQNYYLNAVPAWRMNGIDIDPSDGRFTLKQLNLSAAQLLVENVIANTSFSCYLLLNSETGMPGGIEEAHVEVLANVFDASMTIKAEPNENMVQPDSASFTILLSDFNCDRSSLRMESYSVMVHQLTGPDTPAIPEGGYPLKEIITILELERTKQYSFNVSIRDIKYGIETKPYEVALQTATFHTWEIAVIVVIIFCIALVIICACAVAIGCIVRAKKRQNAKPNRVKCMSSSTKSQHRMDQLC